MTAFGGIQTPAEENEGQFQDAEEAPFCGKLEPKRAASSSLEGGSNYEDETTSPSTSPNETGVDLGRTSSPVDCKKPAESYDFEGDEATPITHQGGGQLAVEKNHSLIISQAVNSYIRKTEVLPEQSRLLKKRHMPDGCEEQETRDSELDPHKIRKISADDGSDYTKERSSSSSPPEVAKRDDKTMTPTSTDESQKAPFINIPRPLPQPSQYGEESFPERLHRMLYQVELERENYIVSFLDHGRAFAVFRKFSFNRFILKPFFNLTIYESFHKLLIEHGFRRLTRDYPRETNVYYHKLFVRGRPELCKDIKRVVGRQEEPEDPESEPDLSASPPSTSVHRAPPQVGVQGITDGSPRPPSNNQNLNTKTMRAPPSTNPVTTPNSSFTERPIVVPRKQYVDCAALPDPPRHHKQSGDNFPEKIHKMLKQTELEGNSHIVSFLNHGRAFAIHDEGSFESLLSRFGFYQKGFDSFRSALLEFGFRKLTKVSDKEAFYHELFLRGRPGLCVNMQSSGAANRGAIKQQHYAEPDLDKYPPIPSMPRETSQVSSSEEPRFVSIAPKPSPKAAAPPTSAAPQPIPAPAAQHIMKPLQRHPLTHYADCATLPDPPKHRNPGEPDDNFAEKLHKMLKQTECEGNAHIVSFLEHGRAFAIHDYNAFQENILFRFGFRQRRFDSFVLELIDHGFKQITSGRDEGSFYHELFLRSRPGLCANLNITTGQRRQAQERPEPNFDEYPPMPAMVYDGQEKQKPSKTVVQVKSVVAPSPPAAAPQSRLLPERNVKTHYADFSAWPDPPRQRVKGDEDLFPEKLHRMLQQVQMEGNSHIVSFLRHGRAFSVHDEVTFEHSLLPRFFPNLRFKDFLALVVAYGFEQLTTGPDSGAFYHELFLRCRPGLCVNMRTRARKQPFNPECQPNFYEYPPLPDGVMIPPPPIPGSHVVAPTATSQQSPHVPPHPYIAYPYPYGPYPYPVPYPVPPRPPSLSSSSTNTEKKSGTTTTTTIRPPYPYPAVVVPPPPYSAATMPQRPAPAIPPPHLIVQQQQQQRPARTTTATMLVEEKTSDPASSSSSSSTKITMEDASIWAQALAAAEQTMAQEQQEQQTAANNNTSSSSSSSSVQTMTTKTPTTTTSRSSMVVLAPKQQQAVTTIAPSSSTLQQTVAATQLVGFESIMVDEQENPVVVAV